MTIENTTLSTLKQLVISLFVPTHAEINLIPSLLPPSPALSHSLHREHISHSILVNSQLVQETLSKYTLHCLYCIIDF